MFYNFNCIYIHYILCISWIIKCLIIIEAWCKHEDRKNLFVCLYSAVYGFWPMEELEMADELTACRNVERGGGSICLGLQCDKVRYT